ncbi:MAG: pyruvate kinase [Planctomycetota bacterium]
MALDRPPAQDAQPPSGATRPFTKIVATIGPASEDRLEEMIDAGLSVARINFSHGTLEDHERRIAKIREAAQDRMVALGILADLPGPKMRTGVFAAGGVNLVEGETVVLRSGSGMAEPGEVLVDVPDLHLALQPGHRVALADGQVELVVTEVAGEVVQARVRRAGTVGDKKGVHLPDSDVHYELPTERDRELIAFAVEQDVDFLGVSFVAHASEVEEVRRLAPGIGIVAKIERTAALANLDQLLEVSDGVMVARGDLGVELSLAQLPITQKDIIERSVEAGSFTITATEMLESMIHSTRPTRAEVTDVANAILDGTDAIMLSAETAVGEHPVAAVRTMAEIAREVEGSKRYRNRPRMKIDPADMTFGTATAMAAVQVADALGLGKIICFTESGNTVRLLSRSRPSSRIIALCPNLGPVRRMTALAHVRPILFRREPSLEDMLYMASETLVVRGLVEYGEEVVFVAGVPPGVVRSTNVMKLHRIGEEVKLS